MLPNGKDNNAEPKADFVERQCVGSSCQVCCPNPADRPIHFSPYKFFLASLLSLPCFISTQIFILYNTLVNASVSISSSCLLHQFKLFYQSQFQISSSLINHQLYATILCIKLRLYAFCWYWSLGLSFSRQLLLFVVDAYLNRSSSGTTDAVRVQPLPLIMAENKIVGQKTLTTRKNGYVSLLQTQFQAQAQANEIDV